MTPLKTRILIAEDHAVVLRGLRMVLNAQPDLEVIAEATDGEQAVDQAVTEQPHLAILDISMPRKTGLQAAREIVHRCPQVRVLMLSMYDDEQYLFEAISAGASGYVLKSAVDRDLVEACRATMRGQPFLYPDGIRALLREYLERARNGDTVRGLLTPREGEILKLVADVHTNEAIGELLQRYAIRRGPITP
jgi:DNA-binding NarL/FixJ family response regulator